MAINTKNFRKITIDEALYYWRVAFDQDVLRLYVTLGDNSASNLHAAFSGQTQAEMAKVEGTEQGFVITPKHVAGVIDYARAQGWEPRHKGPDLRLDIPAPLKF